MELEHISNMEKAMSLLREIEAFLYFNTCPSAIETGKIRKTINEFTQGFPICWECGDTQYIGNDPCLNCNHI